MQNFNKNKNDMLMDAACSGDITVLNILLKSGANPNAANGHGNTALMRAAYNGLGEIVKSLLRAGAYPEEKNENGYTAIDLAEINGYQEIARIIRIIDSSQTNAANERKAA